jgi:hypothetical protein
MHIPPIGPIALLCLSGAALMIERHRESPAHAALPRHGGARDAAWTA